MRISARADYAIRGLLEIAGAEDPPVKRDRIARAQEIPVKFLENILADLKHAGLITSQRGSDGGYALARPADEITVADVMRVIEGPLATIRDSRPEALSYAGSAESLREVWIALRAQMRTVLESVTLAHLLAHDLPEGVRAAIASPAAWEPPTGPHPIPGH
ncbi:Rrf2 family transcriptional regulator [Thermoleophilia bacterium SCSIO 60948]|nr:Rrf2 family transcriptional regulator [Thermoleophilia bacterium SCSIO 60948]